MKKIVFYFSIYWKRNNSEELVTTVDSCSVEIEMHIHNIRTRKHYTMHIAHAPYVHQHASHERTKDKCETKNIRCDVTDEPTYLDSHKF